MSERPTPVTDADNDTQFELEARYDEEEYNCEAFLDFVEMVLNANDMRAEEGAK